MKIRPKPRVCSIRMKIRSKIKSVKSIRMKIRPKTIRVYSFKMTVGRKTIVIDISIRMTIRPKASVYSIAMEFSP